MAVASFHLTPSCCRGSGRGPELVPSGTAGEPPSCPTSGGGRSSSPGALGLLTELAGTQKTAPPFSGHSFCCCRKTAHGLSCAAVTCWAGSCQAWVPWKSQLAPELRWVQLCWACLAPWVLSRGSARQPWHLEFVLQSRQLKCQIDAFSVLGAVIPSAVML